MPLVTLTDLTLPKLKPLEGRQVTYIDKSLKGFGVRVTENGQMSYVLTYGANRQRVKLGDVGVVKLSEARTKAKNLLAEKQLTGHQPTKSPTYESALATFLKTSEAKNRPRTYRDYKRLLTRHGFGLEKLSEIAPKDIARKLDKLPPSEHAHAYAALQIFFRWAVRKNLLDRNPMERTERPPHGKSRDRVLTDAELKAIWHACVGLFGDIIKLCLLTGQRRSEIAQLQWDWIKGGTITIPKEVTKNKREHAFPVGKRATTVIEAQTKRNDTPYLFPARKQGQGRKALFYGSWSKDKAALDTRSGVTDWVIHDLRRTLVSTWAAMGIRQEVTEKYINHVSGSFGGIVGVYQRHTFLPEMQDALKLWEEKLSSVLSV